MVRGRCGLPVSWCVRTSTRRKFLENEPPRQTQYGLLESRDKCATKPVLTLATRYTTHPPFFPAPRFAAFGGKRLLCLVVFLTCGLLVLYCCTVLYCTVLCVRFFSSFFSYQVVRTNQIPRMIPQTPWYVDPKVSRAVYVAPLVISRRRSLNSRRKVSIDTPPPPCKICTSHWPPTLHPNLELCGRSRRQEFRSNVYLVRGCVVLKRSIHDVQQVKLLLL